jgi:hypothetical protein
MYLEIELLQQTDVHILPQLLWASIGKLVAI